ncbi:hypothetical protein HPB49_019759 [Dermacentor silvarum]|uniref:Uncharacterized protein n=1 Tax=Dermacentor silvarum TaxID=543639 RepID=A0ACB8CZ19_DERSI|nr:hypothetical protein HPB49_019759 [Dermacentor silvarum]
MSALFPITRSAEVAESATHLPTARVTSKCSLCGGPHLTADKSCTARCKTPYVIRKRIGERRAATQVNLQESDFPPMNYKHRSRSRSPSRSRQHCSRTPFTFKTAPFPIQIYFYATSQASYQQGELRGSPYGHLARGSQHTFPNAH